MVVEKKKIEKFGNYLLIDGEMYEPVEMNARSKSEYLKFKKIDRKKLEKTVEELSNLLSKEVKSKEIIKNALYDAPMSVLEKIHESLKEKKKPKVKKRYGCFDVVVGKETLSIR